MADATITLQTPHSTVAPTSGMEIPFGRLSIRPSSPPLCLSTPLVVFHKSVFVKLFFILSLDLPVPQTNQLMHIYPQREKGFFFVCKWKLCVCVEYQKTGCRHDKINYLEKRKTHYCSSNRNTFQNKARWQLEKGFCLCVYVWACVCVTAN